MALNPSLGNAGIGFGSGYLNPGLGNPGFSKRPTLNPSLGNPGVPGFADNLNFYTGKTYNSAASMKINNDLSDNRLLGFDLPDKIVTPVRKWTQRLDDKSTLYSDTYNQDQVNSVLDVILKAIDPLENNGSFLKTALRGGVDLMDQLLMKPLVHGDIWAFAMNNLTNLGETVDVLANAVKAVVDPSITTASSEYGLTKENSTWQDRLKLAFGYGVQGRYQFDYDIDPNSTGKDLIPNMLLEVVSDPMNWLTLGSKAVVDLSLDAGTGAAKGVTKLGTDLATSTGLKNSDEFITFFNKFKKPIVNAYAHNDANTFRNILSNVWESFAKSNTIEDFSKAKSKYISAVSNLLEVGDSAATHKMNIAIIDSLEHFKPMYKAVDVFDKIDTTIVRTAARPFLYPMSKGVKRAFKSAAKYIQSSLVTAAANKDPLTRGMYEITLDAMKEAEDNFNKRVTELKMAGQEIPDDLYSVFEEMAISNTRQALGAYEATLGILRNTNLTLEKDITALYARISEALSLATNGKVTDPGTLSKFFNDVLKETPTLKGSLSELTDLLDVVDDIARLYSKHVAVESAYKSTFRSAKDIIKFFDNPENTTIKTINGKASTYRSIKLLDPLRISTEVLRQDNLYRYIGADVPIYTTVKGNVTSLLNHHMYVPVDVSEYFTEVNGFLNGTIRKLIDNAETLATARGIKISNEAIDYLKQVRELLGVGGDKVKILRNLDIDKLEQAMFDASDFYKTLADEHTMYVTSFKEMNDRFAALGKGMQEYHTFIGRVIDKYQVSLSVSLEDTLAQRGKVLEDTIQKIIDSDKYIDSVNESLRHKLTLIKNPDGTYNAEAVNEFCSDLATALDIKIQAIKQWQSNALFVEDAREGVEISGRVLTSSEHSDSTIMSRLIYDDEEHILDVVDDAFLRQSYDLPEFKEIVISPYSPVKYTSLEDWTKYQTDLREYEEALKKYKEDLDLWDTNVKLEKARIEELKRAPKEIPLSPREQRYLDLINERGFKLGSPEAKALGEEFFTEQARLDTELQRYMRNPLYDPSLYKTFGSNDDLIKSKNIQDFDWSKWYSNEPTSQKISLETREKVFKAPTAPLEPEKPASIAYPKTMSHKRFYEEVKKNPDFLKDKHVLSKGSDYKTVLEPRDNTEALRKLNERASNLSLPDISDLVSSALTKGSGDSVQDVLAELTKLSDDLQGANAGTKYFTTDPGIDIARIIPARTSRTMSMLYDPGFMEIAKEIADQSTVSHTLFNKQTIESFRTVQQLSDVADTIVDVYEFFDKLHRYQLVDNWLQTALINTGNDTMVFQAAMNALENMYHISPRQISENADTMAAFIHRVEANLTMNTRTQPISLDHFRNILIGVDEGFKGDFLDDVFDATTLSVRDQKARAALIKVFEEHPELNVAKAHDALADAYFTEAVLRAMSPEDAAAFDNLAKGSTVRIIDTETTMFSGRTGELLQFAGKTWGVDESLNLRVKYMPEEFTQAPDLEVLRTVAKSDGKSSAEIAAMSEEELVNLYKRIFYSAQSEAERYTETQLLIDALTYLEGSSKIIGANNKTFDNKFILDRLRNIQYEQTLRTKSGAIDPEQIHPLIQKFRDGFTVEKFQDDLFNNSVDAQVLIAEKEGMVVLSAKQIEILQAYCEKMGETLEGITSIRSIQPGLLQQNVKQAIKSLEEYLGDYDSGLLQRSVNEALSNFEEHADDLSLSTKMFSEDIKEKTEGFTAYIDFFKRLDDALTGAKIKDTNQDVFNAMFDMRRGKYKYDSGVYIRDFVSEELSEVDKLRYAKYGSESQAKLARTWQRLWELDPSYVKGTEVPESFKAAWLKEHNGVLPTSLYNVIRNSGESSGYGIKWVYRERIAKDFLADTPKTPQFWETAYRGAKRAHDMLDEGRLGNLRHVIGAGLLFENSEDLLDTLKLMQQVGPSGTWWRQLDFDAMPNDALRFAYWKSINYDPRWRAWLRELPETNVLGIDPIKLGLDGLKDPTSSFKLAMKNLGDKTIPESVLKHFTPEQTIIYRLTQLKEAEDVLDHLAAFRNWNIPGGANDYAARQAVAELEKGIAWLKKRPDRIHILRTVERSEQAVRKMIADDFLAKGLEVGNNGKLTEAAKEYLISHLLFEAPYMRVSMSIEGNPFKIDTKTALPKSAFLKHAEELNEIGIGIAKDSVAKEYILYLKGNAKDISLDFTGDVYKATFLGKQYTKPAFTLGSDPHIVKLPRPAMYEHDVDVQEFFDILDRARLNSLYFSAGAGVNTQGMFYKPFTQGSYRWFLDHARFAVPNDWVVTPELLYSSGYFNVPRFNSTGLLSFKALDDVPEPTFLSNPNIITHLLDQYNYAVRRTTNTLLYRDLYFNKEWGMHFDENGVFGEVIRRYGDKADEEIARAFRNSDGTFIVAALTEHKSKQGFRAIQIPIETADDVAKARQLNAVILPYDVYSSSFNVINNASAAQRWFTKIPRMVVYMYKLGYLGTNMGTTFRNAIDSPFKVMVDSGRPIETMKYMYQAVGTYKEFNDIIARMFKTDTGMTLSDTSFNKWFRSADGKAFVSKNRYIKDIDTFRKVWGFFEDGPSSGEATSLIKYKRSKSMYQNRNFVKFVSEKMMAGMAYTEKISRLGQYLMMENAGYTKTQIFKAISDVQFDYNIKSDAMKVIEYFIPFFNFSKMNFEFWMSAIEKNPALVRILDDMIGAQQNAYDIDYENATMERSMLYQMMRGNILIDDNIVLKVNPSYMDAFNILLEPINPAMAAMSGWNRYSTAYGLSTYLNNSNTLGNLIAPLKNLITSTIDEYTIEEKVTKVPFGKYKGLPVEEMLKDPLYMQQLMLSEFGKDKLPKDYPNVWKLMMQNMDKTDRLMYWGKYAGAPIREIMLEHPEYCQYMLSQDWFREQYKDLVDIFVANGLNNIPDVMPWGKYKGKSLDEVRADTKYLEYLNKDNWLQINQPLLYMALIEDKKTIISESDLVLDTIVTKEQAEGLLSYGATLDAVAAENHFKNVMKNWISDPTTYPLIGSLYTRFFSDSATSKRNEERLKNNSEAMQIVGKWFPGIFSATKRWNDNIYESSEAAYDSTRSFYKVDSNSYIPRPSFTKSDESKIARYSKPSGSRNYSRASTYNKYRYNRGFRKNLRGSSDLLRLRLGITNLHLL